MDNLIEIIAKAHRIFKQSLQLWPLAFFQMLAITGLSAFWVLLNRRYPETGLWLFAAWIICSLTSSVIWLNIRTRIQLLALDKSSYPKWPEIWLGVAKSFVVIGLGVGVMYFIKFILQNHWAIYILLSSLLLITILCAMLCAVVIEQKLAVSLRIAWDLWQKATGVLSLCALSFMFGHAMSFSLTRSVFNIQGVNAQFSKSADFVMIFLLFALMVFFSLCVLWMNVFVVTGFLEIIKIVKKGAKKAVVESEIFQAAPDN